LDFTQCSADAPDLSLAMPIKNLKVISNDGAVVKATKVSGPRQGHRPIAGFPSVIRPVGMSYVPLSSHLQGRVEHVRTKCLPHGEIL
jgi:hypothetical protein